MPHPDELRDPRPQYFSTAAFAMTLGGDLHTGEFFNSSAVGWLLRLLFFPSGILSLLLIGLLLDRRCQRMSAKTSTSDDEHDEHDERSDSDKLFAAELEKELERVCYGLKIGKQRQKDLELCGRIDSTSCGYCLGEGGGCFGYVQLPCGHYHHTQCVRRALRHKLFKCADCGDAIVNIECALRNQKGSYGRYIV